jgi:hypothetical protein
MTCTLAEQILPLCVLAQFAELLHSGLDRQRHDSLPVSFGDVSQRKAGQSQGGGQNVANNEYESNNHFRASTEKGRAQHGLNQAGRLKRSQHFEGCLLLPRTASRSIPNKWLMQK